jgi:hypothetical protein
LNEYPEFSLALEPWDQKNKMFLNPEKGSPTAKPFQG